MIGRAPSTIEVIRPLRDGVIADFDAASSILTHYIKKFMKLVEICHVFQDHM